MNEERPVIGIIPLYDVQRESIWLIPGYQKMLEEAGAVPLILPFSTERNTVQQLCRMADGFLFTGGQDVNPSLYGERKSDRCGEILSERDEMEIQYFSYCLDNDVPALGICRGIQFMNAFLGGTLYQDLPSEKGLNHVQKPPYSSHFHSVEVMEGTLLHDILGKDKINVNSYHHQAVRDVSEKLEICAVSEDGIVEALAHREKEFILAVQWHPELDYSLEINSRKIVKYFVDKCRNGRKR